MEISLDTVSKPFKESQCWDLFRQLITGLKYCHDRKVAHRDIKPDNLVSFTQVPLNFISL
jgi:serine/threonine protein kinase